MAGRAPPTPDPSDPSLALITVQIKFSGRTIPLSVTPDSSIKDLKYLLQPLTNVITRGQKLIFKGKVLADVTTLKSSQISNGSKIMLIASEGLHQGDGPIKKDIIPGSRKTIQTNQPQPTIKTRLERWKVTGIVALSECQLKVIPEEVWLCGPSVRILDVSNNYIQEIPASIGLLKSINKLLLSSNDLLDGHINWEAVSYLKSLTVLSLDQNILTSLPPEIGHLTSLRQLNLANNKLTCLPTELASLNHLEILKAGNNRLSSLPSSIGSCHALVEVDFSSNLLEELPSTFGNLQNLKALHLANNGLKSLPNTIFKSCLQLSTLNIHGTEITNDVLRQLDGWEAFDERRRKKHQKQLDFRVGCSSGFDEGADEDNQP